MMLFSNRKFNRCRQLLVAGLIGGAFSTSGYAQQFPPLPDPSQPIAAQKPAESDVKLQVYNVPSELVGTISAQLQVRYHNNSKVQVTTEPKTGQLMIMAPQAVHQEIGGHVSTMLRAANIGQGDGGHNVASTRQRTYQLAHLSWRELEDAVRTLAGSRLAITTDRKGEVASLQITNAHGRNDIIQVDRPNNKLTFLGSGPSVNGWSQVVYSLDQGQADTRNATHIVPLAPAEPRRVKAAIRLVKATTQLGGQTEAQVDVGDTATAMGTIDSLNSESGLFGDVQIEFVDEIDLVIIRGSKRDVQRTLEVIEKIKEQANETQPEVEVYELEHSNAEAVQVLVTELYTNIFEPRQGSVSITALIQPNALLLIGRKETVQSVKDLVAKIDQPLDPNNQLKVIRLKHASSVDIEERIRNFFTADGAGGDARPGLGTRVIVSADYRTNSLIIQASPREMIEVERLIDELDVEEATTENTVKVFALKNTLAEDLQTVIQDIIGGQTTGGDESLASPPSGRLSLVTVDGGSVQSGILAGVVITADTNNNNLIVKAPAKSMALIEKLIKELDKQPGAEAVIKVFQLTNGDATTLATTLQSLFGLAVTAGAGAQSNFLNNFNASSLTGGGDSSLVQLQIAPEARTNSVIVSGSKADLKVIEALVLRLDEDVVESRKAEVVWLQNADATAVATALTTYFQNLSLAQQSLNNGINQIISAQELVNRQVFAVADIDTNSVLLSAGPAYFEQAMNLIERLDRRPPMVVIQVLIAEVQLDDSFELGAEWGLQDGLLFDRQSSTGGTLSSPVFNLGNVLTGPSGGIGLTQNVAGQALSSFGVGRANSAGQGGLILSASSEAVGVLVRALQTANRLQILNRPQLQTMSGREATAQVGQSVPRVIGVTAATGVAPQQVTTADEEVGLLLSVLPRVSPDGLIVMQVGVENSSVGDPDAGIPIGFGVNGEVIRSPIINRTRADTVVSAYSGQTVVFAGLIAKSRSSARSQIPLLGSLPIVGPAFRFDVETEQRRELLVVLTPRLIQTAEDYDTLKNVETSRMSWCLADVLNAHGDVGLSGGNGLWGPAKSSTIYPDRTPAPLETQRTTSNPLYGAPNFGTGSYGAEAFDAGIAHPGLIESGYGVGGPVDTGADATAIAPAQPPQFDNSAAKAAAGGVYRQVGFSQDSNSQKPVATGAGVQQGAYK